MSIESLKRVLTKIKSQAHDMQRERYASRLSPKKEATVNPEEKGEPAGKEDETDEAIKAIRGLLKKA